MREERIKSRQGSIRAVLAFTVDNLYNGFTIDKDMHVCL